MNQSIGTIITIDAPHFNAGIEYDDNDIVVHAAPIIRYMIGWSINQVTSYCTKKGWSHFPEYPQPRWC